MDWRTIYEKTEITFLQYYVYQDVVKLKKTIHLIQAYMEHIQTILKPQI